jgi:L-seryl-tRNA(Ser) seleniumtransferase
MTLRDLPKVDALSRSEALAEFPERVRVQAARAAIDQVRERVLSGNGQVGPSAEELALLEARRLVRPSLRRVINLSGVILHTGLGRARLAGPMVEELAIAARSHANVELDLESGRRGDRQIHVRDYICALTGAEDAHVVNNAAAGVLLALMALASGQEVILSRGQMVEIGGSFRMPDIVRQSGCRLVEVGCTNKTHLRDYSEAICGETAAILRCHRSNFRIVGFTEEPSVAELVELAHSRGLAVIDDVGSGCLIDLSQYGLRREPLMRESIAAGADVVIASGDKLMGGPQAGILAGKREAIDVIRKHPIARCVRIDKLTLGALEATLRLYATGRETEIPTIRYIARPLDEVKDLAQRLAAVKPGAAVVEEGLSEIGGGSVPGEGVPTRRVGLRVGSPEDLARRLRAWETPIVARIEDDRVWLDPRTLEETELPEVVAALEALLD